MGHQHARASSAAALPGRLQGDRDGDRSSAGGGEQIVVSVVGKIRPVAGRLGAVVEADDLGLKSLGRDKVTLGFFLPEPRIFHDINVAADNIAGQLINRGMGKATTDGLVSVATVSSSSRTRFRSSISCPQSLRQCASALLVERWPFGCSSEKLLPKGSLIRRVNRSGI